jgi:hypothetical protein
MNSVGRSVLGIVVGTALLAQAQPVTPPAPVAAAPATPAEGQPTLPSPLAESFVGLDQLGTCTSVSLQVGYSSLHLPDETVRPFRIGFFGEAMTRSGVGAYASLALGYGTFSGTSTKPSDSVTGVGGIELGAVAVRRMRKYTTIFRGGLALPTATDDLDGALVNTFAIYARLTDFANQAPQSTWARISASPLFSSPPWVGRLDVGLDVPLHSPDRADQGTLLRLNAAAGYVAGVSQISLEVTNLLTTNPDVINKAVHSIGVSYRARLPGWQPFVEVHETLGLGDRDDEVGVSYVAGVTVPTT